MSNNTIKIVAVSDIHGDLPKGIPTMSEPYILCLVGDILPDYKASRVEILSLQLDWCNEVLLPWLLKDHCENDNCHGIILVGGNHDHLFETYAHLPDFNKIHPKMHYLKMSHVTICGLKFYGTPITYNPGIVGKNWAFGDRDECGNLGLEAMDSDTNILLAHSPIRGCLDLGYDPIAGDMKNMGGLGFKRFIKESIHNYPYLSDIYCGHMHENGGNSNIYRVRDIRGDLRRINVHSCCARLESDSNENPIHTHEYKV